MPTLGHTVCSGVIGSAETALCGGQKGVPADTKVDQPSRRRSHQPADDPVSLHADDASELYAAEDVELYSRRYVRL